MTAFQKDLLREIKTTLGRFLSLLIITALGAATVVGIQAAAIDMRKIADSTFRERNLYDIAITSMTGFTDDDVAALRDIPRVRAVMPTKFVDAYVNIDGDARAVRAHALPTTLNRVVAIDGHLPEAENQVSVEPDLLAESDLRIGDSITFSLDSPGMLEQMLGREQFVIVGTVSSPRYIAPARGSTMLGDGSLQYFVYLSPEAFRFPGYTEVFLLMTGSDTFDQMSQEYFDAAEGWQREVKARVSPEWTVATRQEGLSYDSYYQDTQRLQRIGWVFPLVFFAVAILVSLTTMSRMVEDQRTQIGIYKALGYRPLATMAKFLVYAFLASGLGGMLGVVLGSTLLPRVIADAYGHLYDLPPVATPIPWGIALIAILAAVGSVVAVTLATCLGEMRGAPAMLMRPKPPRAGKRVWLEHLTPLWSRMTFLSKVAARNIFRYKRRFVMTLVGVAGCGALLLTAFGLRDSIGGISDLQFGEIMKYDARVYLRDIDTPQRRDALVAVLPENRLFVREEAVTVAGNGESMRAELVTPENPSLLPEFVRLATPDGEVLPMTTDSVLVTEKLASALGIVAGSPFTITLASGNEYELTATDVVENYVNHFIYIGPRVYRETLKTRSVINSVLLFTGADGADGPNKAISTMLRDEPDVLAVIQTADIRANLSDSTDALGVVTWVLIALAGALALVVLFNLTNINISERIRELATIKVLGFNDTELSRYIYRENAAVTAFGIVAGLIGGVFLHRFVLSTVAMDIVKFPMIIHPISYLLAALITVGFAAFVNIVMKFRLANIDMVESLKSVE